MPLLESPHENAEKFKYQSRNARTTPDSVKNPGAMSPLAAEMRYTVSFKEPPQAMVLFPSQGRLQASLSSFFAIPASSCEHQHSLRNDEWKGQHLLLLCTLSTHIP